MTFPQRTPKAIDAMSTPFSVHVLPSGQVIRYRLTFPDELQRPTVLLASLLATTAAIWDGGVVDALHRHGFRVIAYDHPGHGGSSAPADLGANTFEAMADGVYGLVTAVLPLGHAPRQPQLHAWIGCSLGAATGVVFATRYPGIVRHLVVCDTISCSPVNAGIEDGFTPRVQAARQSGSLESLLASTRERWLGTPWLTAHPDKEAWLRALMSETTLDGYETCIAALLAPGFDLTGVAPSIATSVESVLLVVGEKDLPLPTSMQTLADQMRAGFVSVGKDQKAVQFQVLPNAGHSSFLDGFDAWCEVVLPFLKRHCN